MRPHNQKGALSEGSWELIFDQAVRARPAVQHKAHVQARKTCRFTGTSPTSLEGYV
jgi:hypothetical protein